MLAALSMVSGSPSLCFFPRHTGKDFRKLFGFSDPPNRSSWIGALRRLEDKVQPPYALNVIGPQKKHISKT